LLRHSQGSSVRLHLLRQRLRRGHKRGNTSPLLLLLLLLQLVPLLATGLASTTRSCTLPQPGHQRSTCAMLLLLLVLHLLLLLLLQLQPRQNRAICALAKHLPHRWGMQAALCCFSCLAASAV
jgi:hypothetical protein